MRHDPFPIDKNRIPKCQDADPECRRAEDKVTDVVM